MYGMNQFGGCPGAAGVPSMTPSPWQYHQPSQFGQQGMAQNQPQQPQEAPFDGLTRVTGMQGAKAYQMPANSRAALFDDTDDVVIIKMTDGAGFPSYKRARLDWIEDEPENEYLTRAEFRKEFEELKGLILNGKQSVSNKRKNGDAGDE